MLAFRLAHTRRPIGVTLIAAVQAINALTLGLQLVLASEDPSVSFRVLEDPGFAPGLFIILGLVTAAGLWQLMRWAWVATMLWAGFVMLAGLIAYYNGNPVSYFTMAVTLVQVLYLNLTEVQEAFSARGRREDHDG